jgi:hypothetical protein
VKQGAVSLYTSSFYKDVQVTAFENPDGQMVVVVNNMGRKRKDVRVYINKQFYPLPLDAKSKYVLVIE